MKSKLFRIIGVVAVVAMLAASIVAPVAAVGAVTLGDTNLTISANSTSTPAAIATVSFGVISDIPAGTAGIVITFDPAWTLGTVTAQITTLAGFGSTAITAIPITVTSVVGQVVTLSTSTAGVGFIGHGGAISIDFLSGVTNPGTAGSYGVTAKTSSETTAVASNTLAFVNPVVPPPAGIATVLNSAGIPLSSSNSLTTALGAVPAGGSITLTAGTYNTAFVGNGVACTITGLGTTPADVVIKSTAPWSMTGTTVTISNLTIDGGTGFLTMTNATAGTIKTATLKGDVVVFSGAGTNTVDTCTVVVATTKTGINATTATTVKNSTFSMAGSGLGITAGAALTVSGDTFTGTTGAGLGIALTAGTGSNIGTSKFTGLTTAFSVAGGAAGTFTGNTVDVCGIATTGPSTIEVTGNGALFITNNTITNSLYYIMNVTAGGTGNLINMMMNTFKGNAKNVTNASATAVNASHNFWSGAAVPADTIAPNLVTYNPAIGAAPTASASGIANAAGAFDASTAGVKFVSNTVGTNLLSATVLGASPNTAALPANVTAKRYFDVFAVGGLSTTNYVVDFFGATGAAVGATDAIYFYNAGTGQWLPASSQTTNAFGGYVEVTINGTGTTTAPTATQFSGLPFVLVTVLPAAPPVVVPGTASTPDQAAVGVDVNTPFTWTAAPGADHYDFVLAEDLGTTNKFDIIDYSLTTPVNGAPSKETLKYNTVYWWRVRSVSSAGFASAWTNYFFTTEDVPPVVTTTTPPVITTVVTSVVVTQPPAVTTVVTTTGLTITNTQTSTEAIPSYLLWAVIAVGAILIISVIVLIVRTRKI